LRFDSAALRLRMKKRRHCCRRSRKKEEDAGLVSVQDASQSRVVQFPTRELSHRLDAVEVIEHAIAVDVERIDDISRQSESVVDGARVRLDARDDADAARSADIEVGIDDDEEEEVLDAGLVENEELSLVETNLPTLVAVEVADEHGDVIGLGARRHEHLVLHVATDVERLVEIQVGIEAGATRRVRRSRRNATEAPGKEVVGPVVARLTTVIVGVVIVAVIEKILKTLPASSDSDGVGQSAARLHGPGACRSETDLLSGREASERSESDGRKKLLHDSVP